MRTTWSLVLSTSVTVVGLSGLLPRDAVACDVFYESPSIQRIVDRAEDIVVVQALGIAAELPPCWFGDYPERWESISLDAGLGAFARLECERAETHTPDLKCHMSVVSFRVVEALKGRLGEGQLLHAVADQTTGYARSGLVSPNSEQRGWGGACFKRDYKVGAHYLLILSKMRLYRFALRPTNEEVRARDDPWTAWVREQIRSAAQSRPDVDAPPSSGTKSG